MPNTNCVRSLSEVISNASSRKRGDTFFEFAVAHKVISDIKQATGLDVTGFTHSIDEHAIRHVMKRHGPSGSADQSVTQADLAILPEILNSPDSISAGTVARKTTQPETVEFRKQVGDNWLVVSEVLTGRKRLALLAMRKEKAVAP